MKQVQIQLTGKDVVLRDTTKGKTYEANRYDDGEFIPAIGEKAIEYPSYVFLDDVGDEVQTIPSLSGRFVKEV